MAEHTIKVDGVKNALYIKPSEVLHPKDKEYLQRVADAKTTLRFIEDDRKISKLIYTTNKDVYDNIIELLESYIVIPPPDTLHDKKKEPEAKEFVRERFQGTEVNTDFLDDSEFIGKEYTGMHVNIDDPNLSRTKRSIVERTGVETFWFRKHFSIYSVEYIVYYSIHDTYPGEAFLENKNGDVLAFTSVAGIGISVPRHIKSYFKEHGLLMNYFASHIPRNTFIDIKRRTLIRD